VQTEWLIILARAFTMLLKYGAAKIRVREIRCSQNRALPKYDALEIQRSRNFMLFSENTGVLETRRVRTVIGVTLFLLENCVMVGPQ
jgi:hypothetical protein